MPSVLKFNEKLHIIEIVHTGTISGDDLRAHTEDAVAFQKQHGAENVLIDTSKLEAMEIVSMYDLPRQYEGSGAPRAVRIALVKPQLKAAQKMTQFYDDVCNNRGWTVQQFDSRDEAVLWLMGQPLAWELRPVGDR